MEGHSFKPNVANFVKLMQERQFLDDVPDAKNFSNDNSNTVNNPWLPSTSSTCADMLGDYGSLWTQSTQESFPQVSLSQRTQQDSNSLPPGPYKTMLELGQWPQTYLWKTQISSQGVLYTLQTLVQERQSLADVPNAKNFSNDNSGTVHNPWIPETSSTRADAWGLRCLLD